MADQDYGHCDECGKSLTADDAYHNAADAILSVLDDLEDPYARLHILALAAGMVISSFVPEDQRSIRNYLGREITRETRGWNIAGCDA